jgi:hypothetical protein
MFLDPEFPKNNGEIKALMLQQDHCPRKRIAVPEPTKWQRIANRSTPRL